MGGDSQPPYIYEASLQHKNRIAYPYSDFNPRAYTQASYVALQAKQERADRPKPSGPLINFNQHPDSYMVVGGQNVKYDPMPANTKQRVTIVRWAQFAIRLIQEIGALGLLVCVICIKGMATSLSWIFRVAPAWDAVITLYAIYHLARNAKSRPPASSASYHMFALFMDVGLIPFYIFIAIFANNNYHLPGNDALRWTSFFPTIPDTSLLLLVTFAVSTALASLHLVTGVVDVWLIIVFRKMSQLPPDMNPLEDNLTARPNRASKHKYKNSEATLTEPVNEKDWKHLSGSTLSVDRFSRTSTANGKGYEVPDPRQMPFRHSRTDSDATFSPHNPQTARMSREQLNNGGLYDQPPSKRASYVETSIEVPQVSTNRSGRPESYAEPRKAPFGTDLGPARYSSPALPNAATPDAVVKTQQKQGLLNDNWYVLDDDASDAGSPSRDRNTGAYDPQHPLRMNPPTPHNDQFPDAEDDMFIDQLHSRSALAERGDYGNASKVNRSLTVQSINTQASSVYSESAPSLKSSMSPPKGKYYGDLAAATMGVRGKPSDRSLNARNTAYDATGMAADFYGFAASPPPEKMKRGSPAKADGRTPRRDKKVRVISRTGADIADNMLYPSEYSKGFGVRERREVSGKVAEEGRGGGWMGKSRW